MKTTLPAYWRGMASGTSLDPGSRLLRACLVPASLVYALVQGVRTELYRRGILGTRRLPRPVISIGNIAAGGTGKTPVTALVARLLMARGVRVAVLSRGYGGSLEGEPAIVSDGCMLVLSADQCGDEPFLLAESVLGLVVVIGSNRYAAGQLAMEVCNPDIFLLDDGFQHLRLERDLNILLLDCTRPFGNGWTLPAGLLRETRRSVGRADVVLLTRCPKGVAPVSPVPDRPCCRVRYELGDLLPLAGGEPLRFEALRDCTVAAFSGIAEPDSFEDGLRGQGLRVVASLRFPDHVVYSPARLTEIDDILRRSGADYAITTEKDGVKLGRLPQPSRQKILMARLSLAIDDPALLSTRLFNLLQK